MNAALWWIICGCAQATNPAANISCGSALSGLHPAAGSTVTLKRGCIYSGSLSIGADNVTVTAYGTGAAPVIELRQDGAAVSVYGSRDVIENLSLVGVAPSTWTCGGRQTPAGHVDGVDIYPGAADNTVSSVSATGFYAAVYVMAAAIGNVVENSTFTSNTELDSNSPSGSAGAFGVLLWGNNNTVEHNTITDNLVCSLAYGQDGSAVEIFGGSHNSVRSNSAWDDNAFTELGSYSGHVATGNSYVGNTVTDGSSGSGAGGGRAGMEMTFLVTRGSLDGNGPVHTTVATDNQVTLTAPGDSGAISYAWRHGDGTLLTLTGNDLDLGSNQALYEDGGYVDGGGNTLTGTCNPSSACS